MQQIFKDMLAPALLKLTVGWFPTPTTARISLETLHESHKGQPEYGDFKDNASALDVATLKLEAGETADGLTTLSALRAHITHTQEEQSRTWLLPKIRALLSRYSVS